MLPQTDPIFENAIGPRQGLICQSRLTPSLLPFDLGLIVMAQPSLLLLDEPSNHSPFFPSTIIVPSADKFLVDLNALAWLEDYLQTWPGILVVVYVST
jgi:hypothetical protein